MLCLGQNIGEVHRRAKGERGKGGGFAKKGRGHTKKEMCSRLQGRSFGKGTKDTLFSFEEEGEGYLILLKGERKGKTEKKNCARFG